MNFRKHSFCLLKKSARVSDNRGTRLLRFLLVLLTFFFLVCCCLLYLLIAHLWPCLINCKFNFFNTNLCLIEEIQLPSTIIFSAILPHSPPKWNEFLIRFWVFRKQFSLLRNYPDWMKEPMPSVLGIGNIASKFTQQINTKYLYIKFGIFHMAIGYCHRLAWSPRWIVISLSGKDNNEKRW